MLPRAAGYGYVMSTDRIDRSSALMERFAERTALTAPGRERRYLWTDAFAVCNFLGLAAATGDPRPSDLALRLIERVHTVLGRHRGDDGRSGWLSGLDADEAGRHPTRGGLRIGKPLPERRPHEPLDDRLEWDRDGQYFHYLTKWMHGLDQAARAMANARFNRWARELAVAAHAAFVHTVPGDPRRRMYWKMSIDLSRPQVESMGQHDPLDGFITCAALDATAATLPPSGGPPLGTMTADFASMITVDRLATADPLGLGGLLCDAYRIAQLTREGAWPEHDRLLDALLAAAALGLRHYARGPELRARADERLAFRELGLAIGLAAAERLRSETLPSAEARRALAAIAAYMPLRDAIESFWLVAEHRQEPTWHAHEDINDVMLATALAPDGFLVRA